MKISSKELENVTNKLLLEYIKEFNKTIDKNNRCVIIKLS